jgi:FtsX-like permease family protein
MGTATPGDRGTSAGIAGARRRLASAFGAPWVRAPLLLFRFPGLLVSVGTAVLILAVAGSASPLFLSSAGNATLQQGIADTCPWEVGAKAIKNAPVAGRAFSSFGFGQSGGPTQSAISRDQETDAYIRSRMGQGLQHVGPVEGDVSSSISHASATGAAGGPSVNVRLYTRDGGLDHVTKLASAGGGGVWISGAVAGGLDLQPGDSITFTGSLANANRRAKGRVAGVYRDLLEQSPTPYWCAQYHLIYPLSAFANSNPPSLVMMDRPTFLALAKKLGERDATFTYVLPVRPEGLTLEEAKPLGAGLQALLASLGAANPFGGPGVVIGGARRTTTLPSLIDRADKTVISLRRSVDTVSLAGRLVALAVIAASGIYWVSRRRSEVALFSSRGVGMVGIGAKVFLEILPIAAVGAAGGWLLGIWLSKLLGPTDLLDPTAPSQALRQVVSTVAIGVFFLAVVAAVSARREVEGGSTRGRETLARAPWEVAVLLLAGASLYEILSRGTNPVSSTSGGTPKLDVLVLLFPILFLAGASGLAVRLVAKLLPALRAAGRRRSHAAFLASRRIAASSRMALALVTATALAIGILVYSGALARSVRATSDAKARVFIGSDVAVTVAEDIPVPAALRGTSTKVSLIDTGYLLPDQDSLGVLGVDPSTFASAAFWDTSFAGKPLDQLLADLKPSGDPPSPVPVLVAGGDLPTTGTLVFRGGPARIPVKVVDVVRAFPGMTPGRPFVVADQDALAAWDAPGFSSIWSKADPELVRRSLPNGLHILAFVTAGRVQEDPAFRSLSWALGFLQALGFMTGLIVLGGVLLYLEARQRSREVSYALAKRMGLTAGAHRRSVVIELGAMLGIGAALGALLAWVGARLVYGQIDAMPTIPPPPLFRTPLGLLGMTAVALLAAAWIGAWRVQRTTEHARVAEVMRLAG